MGKNILVYNNCSNIAKMIIPFCAYEGICVRWFETGGKPELSSCGGGVHLILLDCFADKNCWADGIKLIKRIRKESKVPIIAISGKGAEAVKIMALNAGADDSVSTEVSPLELFARIKSQLRRYTQMGDAYRKVERKFKVDGLEVDDVQQVVTVNGREVRLTPTEYKILRLLIKEKGKIFSGDEIYKEVWDMRPVGVENTIAVHIRHIREKIEENPASPHYLKVVWGRGYMVG